MDIQTTYQGMIERGFSPRTVRLCSRASTSCRVHHPNTPSPEQIARERAEERKRIAKEKLAITARHRVLAAILEKVSAPLKKPDLLDVAHYVIGQLSYNQAPAIAKRHRVDLGKRSSSPQELLASHISNYDEAAFCRILLELSLLDSAYRRNAIGREDTLLDVAKRYRVDVDKLQKVVAQEFAAKAQKKRVAKKRAATT